MSCLAVFCIIQNYSIFILCLFFILLHLGARGATQRAIESAVCIPHDFHCIHFQMRKLREKLTTSLQMASQIYHNPCNCNRRLKLWNSETSRHVVKVIDVTILCSLSQTWIWVSLSLTSPSSSMKQYPLCFWKPVREIQRWSTAGWQTRPTIKSNTWSIQCRPAQSWCCSTLSLSVVSNVCVQRVFVFATMVKANKLSICASGRWNVSFDVKPRKGFFSKLNGDLVKVPILFHQSYPGVMIQAVDLKAQVLSSRCLSFY